MSKQYLYSWREMRWLEYEYRCEPVPFTGKHKREKIPSEKYYRHRKTFFGNIRKLYSSRLGRKKTLPPPGRNRWQYMPGFGDWWGSGTDIRQKPSRCWKDRTKRRHQFKAIDSAISDGDDILSV